MNLILYFRSKSILSQLVVISSAVTDEEDKSVNESVTEKRGGMGRRMS